MREPDRQFADAELAALYDIFDDDRSDLDVYAELIVAELGARSVLDIGCGTGSLPIRLLNEGEILGVSLSVIGVDPALASLDVARRKPGAEHVRWIHGRAVDAARARQPIVVDLAVMSGNVAQVFVDDDEWDSNLVAIASMLASAGLLVFETRDPSGRAWEDWTRARSLSTRDVDGIGRVESWVEVTRVDLPLVTFDSEFRFLESERAMTSTSTLRFRTRDELSDSLDRAGFDIVEVRDAPDRPGKEFVTIAQHRA